LSSSVDCVDIFTSKNLSQVKNVLYFDSVIFKFNQSTKKVIFKFGKLMIDNSIEQFKTERNRLNEIVLNYAQKGIKRFYSSDS